MNPQQQALLARLASYLEQQDQADTAAPTAGVAEAPDLFTLLSELAALRNEVKIESRQVKAALDQFGELFDLLRDAHRRLQDDLCWKYLDCAARFDCRTLPGYRPQRLRMLQFACTPRRRAKAALFALSPELFRRVMNH